VGVCDPTTGVCSNPNAVDGTACNDGNPCTQSDTCQSGQCAGSNPVVCAALDGCHLPGTCDPSTGACSNPTAADGTTCSDGNACTQIDSCQSGICTGSNPVVCAAPDPCHTAGACDPSTGACSNLALPDGTACNDGNACTQTDTCQSGNCTGSNPVTCPYLPQCGKLETCAPATGACTVPAGCSFREAGDPCSFDLLCASGHCQSDSTCATGPTSLCPYTICDHLVDCYDDPGTCDPNTSICVNTVPSADGTPCSSSPNAATAVCQGGVCEAVTCLGPNVVQVVNGVPVCAPCPTGTGFRNNACVPMSISIDQSGSDSTDGGAQVDLASACDGQPSCTVDLTSTGNTFVYVRFHCYATDPVAGKYSNYIRPASGPWIVQITCN
jgi:hypothetical protein